MEKGDPNTSADYKNAVGALYALSYTIKMSKKAIRVRPDILIMWCLPLEGLCSTEEGGFDGKMITDKSKFCWTSPDQADLTLSRRKCWNGRKRYVLRKSRRQIPLQRTSAPVQGGDVRPG